jgi:hypothetical protein
VTRVSLFKAQDTVRDQPVPSLEIVAYHAIPDSPTLEAAAEAFQADAKQVVTAMLASLPGGTVDQILVELLRAKASHFVVPHGTKEPTP